MWSTWWRCSSSLQLLMMMVLMIEEDETTLPRQLFLLSNKNDACRSHCVWPRAACLKADLIAQIHRRLRDYYGWTFFGHACAAEVLARDVLDPAKIGDPNLQRRFRNANLVRKMHMLSLFYCECQGYMKYPSGEVVAFGHQYTHITSFGGGFATAPDWGRYAMADQQAFLRQHDCGNGAGASAGRPKTGIVLQSTSSSPPNTPAAQQWSSEQMYSFLEVLTRPRGDENHRSSEEKITSKKPGPDSSGSALGSAPHIQTTVASKDDRSTTTKTPPNSSIVNGEIGGVSPCTMELFELLMLAGGVSPCTMELFELMLAEFTLPEYIAVNRLDKNTQERLARQPPWIIAALVEGGPLVTAFNPSA